MSLRNRELLNLIAVGLLTAIGFASVYIARSEPSELDAGSLTYAGIFMALYLRPTSSSATPPPTPTRCCCRSPGCSLQSA